MIAGIASTLTSNETSCAVMVVPIFVPMMMPTACARFSSPALMKPITITVLALEDWITAVTPAPASSATKRFCEKKRRIPFIRSPATFCRPSLIICIPHTKIANPANAFSISVQKFRPITSTEIPRLSNCPSAPSGFTSTR